MDIECLQKDCDALGGLFQLIVNDMKGSSPVWDDFINKATKFHSVLRTTAVATGVFLDAFQKVADLANSSRGASREIGSTLTRLCFRHRSIENKLKTFASTIIEQVVEPLQGKMDEWKRTAVAMDKDHTREYKRAQQEIKKASADVGRLRKRAGKGRTDSQQKLDQVIVDVREKYKRLEEVEKSTVRSAMIEERSHFCFFVNCLKPLMDIEVSMLHEVTRIQEVIDVLSGQVEDSNSLPACGEQVLLDLKGMDSTWKYRTPPGSPVVTTSSQLGSRKSSLCSVDSSSSGSTQLSTLSPSHGLATPLSTSTSVLTNDAQQTYWMRQLSSVSSQDSGFVSHEVMPLDFAREQGVDGVLKTSSRNDIRDSSGCSPDCGSVSGLSWHSSCDELKHSASGPAFCTHLSANERPHTISSGYERSHSRPMVTSQTFEPPSVLPVRSRPSSSVYAVPTGHGHRTADIYARPMLCGRRVLPGAGPQPVAPPTAPAEYASCGIGGILPLVGSNMTIAEEQGTAELNGAGRLLRHSLSSPSSESMQSESAKCDDLNQAKQRRLFLNDDNYIMNTANICDSHRHSSSQDLESMLELMRSKQQLSNDGRSMTLPRCMPFKVPQVPMRTASVIDQGALSSDCQARVKPPPPQRRDSVRSDIGTCLSTSTTASEASITSQENDRDEQQEVTAKSQPKQQAPPVDDTDSVLLSPPPASVSCSIVDDGFQWPATDPASLTSCSVIDAADGQCSTLPPSSTVKTIEMPCQLEMPTQKDPLQPDTAVSDSEDNSSNMLTMIRRGVTLRKTISNDRSAPRVG